MLFHTLNSVSPDLALNTARTRYKFWLPLALRSKARMWSLRYHSHGSLSLDSKKLSSPCLKLVRTLRRLSLSGCLWPRRPIHSSQRRYLGACWWHRTEASLLQSILPLRSGHCLTCAISLEVVIVRTSTGSSHQDRRHDLNSFLMKSSQGITASSEEFMTTRFIDGALAADLVEPIVPLIAGSMRSRS